MERACLTGCCRSCPIWPFKNIRLLINAGMLCNHLASRLTSCPLSLAHFVQNYFHVSSDERNQCDLPEVYFHRSDYICGKYKYQITIFLRIKEFLACEWNRMIHLGPYHRDVRIISLLAASTLCQTSHKDLSESFIWSIVAAINTYDHTFGRYIFLIWRIQIAYLD